jgi:hypothetical protein
MSYLPGLMYFYNFSPNILPFGTVLALSLSLSLSLSQVQTVSRFIPSSPSSTKNAVPPSAEGAAFFMPPLGAENFSVLPFWRHG